MNGLNLVEIRHSIVNSPAILPIEIGSLAISLNNCIESNEAGAMMNDDQQLYQIALSVVESIELMMGNELNNVTDTVWNMLCWLRESLGKMMYLKFDVSAIIRHDLNIVPINKIMPLLTIKILCLFNGSSVHYNHAVRYLLVLNEILNEKGVL